mmetsp:Transcript_9479/g.21035  ORF Transcript_9479/g.21035 Transcript_9479/m.21035 type:complete len:241 (-) Transcript_9479:617-1339(-)
MVRVLEEVAVATPGGQSHGGAFAHRSHQQAAAPKVKVEGDDLGIIGDEAVSTWTRRLWMQVPDVLAGPGLELHAGAGPSSGSKNGPKNGAPGWRHGDREAPSPVAGDVWHHFQQRLAGEPKELEGARGGLLELLEGDGKPGLAVRQNESWAQHWQIAGWYRARKALGGRIHRRQRSHQGRRLAVPGTLEHTGDGNLWEEEFLPLVQGSAWRAPPHWVSSASSRSLMMHDGRRLGRQWRRS